MDQTEVTTKISPLEELQHLRETGQLRWKALFHGEDRKVEFHLEYTATNLDDHKIVLTPHTQSSLSVTYHRWNTNVEPKHEYKTGADADETELVHLLDKNKIFETRWEGRSKREDTTEYLRQTFAYVIGLFNDQQPFRLDDILFPGGNELSTSLNFRTGFVTFGETYLHLDVRHKLPELYEAARRIAQESCVLYVNETAQIITPTLDAIVKVLERRKLGS